VINILTGPVHSGKTTLLKNTIPVLREKNFRVDGYLSDAIWKNEEFIGYDLIDLKDHRYHPFIRKQGQQDWQRIGPFYFLPRTLDIAKKIIHRSKKADLCVVDEVGPLELTGKGVWPILKDILMIPKQDVLLVVRESLLKNFMEKIQRDDFVVYDIEQNKKPLGMAESLMQDLEKRKKSEQK
jgi:nucleoside-triphosphatase THEP1